MTSKDIRVIKLNDCASFSQGKQIPVEEQYNQQDENMVRFVRIVDFTNPSEPARYIKNYGESYIVSEKDIIMIRYGSQTAGKVVRGIPGIIANNMFKICADENLFDKDFLYYFLSMKKIYDTLMQSQSSSTMPAITFGMLNNIEIPMFNIKTQKQIAKIIQKIDDKIELNNKINQNLEQQAQAIFKSWFVNFEPFGGKMPDDWRIGKLEELTQIKSGKRPQLKQADKDDNFSIPIIGASTIMGYTNAILYNEPILITGRVGTHGIINKYNKQCWPSDNTLVIKSKYYEYIYQQLKRIDFAGLNRGSTQPLITQKDLLDIDVVIPTSQKAKEYEQFATQLSIYQDNLITEKEKLTQLRDTLLPKLMNGEIDVDKVEV